MLVKNQTDPSGSSSPNRQTPQIITRLGNDVVHRRVGTRPVDAEKACNTAFLLALADSQKRAKKLSANAVVNIISYL